METNRILLIVVYSAVTLYFLYRMFRKNRPLSDYEKLYNEILTSDKYKVKGQYDRKE